MFFLDCIFHQQPLPEGDAKDKDYVPHGIPSRQAIKPPSTGGYSRRVKRQAPEVHPVNIFCTLLMNTLKVGL